MKQNVFERIDSIHEKLNRALANFSDSAVAEIIRADYKKTEEKEELAVYLDWMEYLVQNHPFNRGYWATMSAIRRRMTK